METNAMKQYLVLLIAVLQQLSTRNLVTGNSVFRRQVNGHGAGRRGVLHAPDRMIVGYQPETHRQNDYYHGRDRLADVHPSRRQRPQYNGGASDWMPIVATQQQDNAAVVVRNSSIAVHGDRPRWTAAAARQPDIVAFVTLPTTTVPVTANGGLQRPYNSYDAETNVYYNDNRYYQHTDADGIVDSKNKRPQHAQVVRDVNDRVRENGPNFDFDVVYGQTPQHHRNGYAAAVGGKNESFSHTAVVVEKDDGRSPPNGNYHNPSLEDDLQRPRVVSSARPVNGQILKQENQNLSLNVDVAAKTHHRDYENENSETVVDMITTQNNNEYLRYNNEYLQNNNEYLRNNNEIVNEYHPDLTFNGHRGEFAVVENNNNTHDGRNAVEVRNEPAHRTADASDQTEREQRQPVAVEYYVLAAEPPVANVDVWNRSRQNNRYVHADTAASEPNVTDGNKGRVVVPNDDEENERRDGKNDNGYYYLYDRREKFDDGAANESAAQTNRLSTTPPPVQRKEIERRRRPSTTPSPTTPRPRQRRRKVQSKPQSSAQQTRRPSANDQNGARDNYDDAAAGADHRPSNFDEPTTAANQRQTATIHNDGNADDERPASGYGFGYAVLDEYAGNDFGQWERREPGQDGAVTGQYRVRLPDGRTQTVRYSVHPDTGYRATVTYEGVQHYPPPAADRAYDSVADETSSSD